MTNPNKLVCLFFVLLLLSSCREKPRPATSKLMPEGFEYIYLGMDVTIFLKKKGLGFDSMSNLYYIEIENPNQSFIQSVEFSLAPSRYIRFRGQGSPECVVGFIFGCIEKWGRDFEKRIAIGKANDSIYYNPTLYWKKEDARIWATYTHPITVKSVGNSEVFFTIEFHMPRTHRFRWATEEITNVSEDLEVYFDQIDNIDSLFENYSGPIFK